MANYLVAMQQVANEFRPQLEAFALLDYETQMRKPRQTKRAKRNSDKGFPASTDYEKALKLAAKVDADLPKMMEAKKDATV